MPGHPVSLRAIEHGPCARVHTSVAWQQGIVEVDRQLPRQFQDFGGKYPRVDDAEQVVEGMRGQEVQQASTEVGHRHTLLSRPLTDLWSRRDDAPDVMPALQQEP